MSRTRRKITISFKTKVVIEALKERLTTSEIAARYEVHPNQINSWKREFLDNAESVFDQGSSKKELQEAEAMQGELYKEIGRPGMDNNWSEKKLP